MKKLKLFAFALAATALVFTTSCNRDDNGAPIYVPDPWERLDEEPPALDNPGPGYVTIAIHVPTGTICAGARIGMVGENIYGVGDFDIDNILEAPLFVQAAGKNNWFVVTLPTPADPEDEMVVRPIGISPDGYAAWGQRAGELEILLGPGEVAVSSYGDPQFVNLADGSIVFAVVWEWNMNPCEINPAGYASFHVTTPVEFPAGAQIGAVGNFPGRNWNIGDPIILEFIDGVWRAYDVAVNRAAEFDLFYRLPGGNWAWDNRAADADGNRYTPPNFTIPGTNQAVITIPRWVGWPPILDPALWPVLIHGSAVSGTSSWTDAVPTFVSTADGTYVWSIQNLEMHGGGAFGIRVNGVWYAFNTDPALVITGDRDNFTGTGNPEVTQTRIYNVTISVTVEDGDVVSVTANFVIA